MGNLETNGPTWSRSSASRTRGRGLNGSDIPKRKKECACLTNVGHAALSFVAFLFSFLVSLPCFEFWLPYSSYGSLTHPITYELPLSVHAPGTNPCGRIETNNVVANIATHGMMYHQYVDSGKYSSSSILKQFVHSWPKSMVMSWSQQPVKSYLLVEWKNSLCSPTMSWSTHTTWKHSRWTDCCTTSANTSCTRGIAILNPHLWTSVGKTRPGTPSPFANEYRLIDLLDEYRPHWTRGQEFGILFPNNYSAFHFPESAIYHAPELPWGTSQPQYASINREKKVRLASCSTYSTS